MSDVFAASPLLLLFTVAAVGYLIGRLEIFGTKLGVAAVLFVGLGFGAWDARLQLPELIQTFGLVLFVYTIGLSCGPTFVSTLRGSGFRQNTLVCGMIAFAACAALALDRLLGLDAASSAGLFAGALTNTPALAAVTELAASGATPGAAGGAGTQAVVAYSIAYPFGVLGVIAVLACSRIFRTAAAPAPSSEPKPSGRKALVGRTLRVTRGAMTERPLAALLAAERLEVVAGRRLSEGKLSTVEADATLRLGDLVTVVGREEEVARAAAVFGGESDVHLEEDRSRLDFRRILLSNPKLAGHRLGELQMQLRQRFGAVVTRLRRGDVEILPNGKLVLEMGDRLRVVCPHDELTSVGRYLGDSERKVSEVDVISLGLGIALGLVLGSIPVPLPGGLRLHLGLAGGPMVAALVLGAFSRTGPILWSLPHGANLTLRQLGLALFLAGVGTRAGGPFIATLSSGGLGWRLFLAGGVMTVLTAALAVLLGRRWLKLPVGTLYGVVAGMQTQPALLAYGQEQEDAEEVSLGYASVFPLAFLAKVILAQIVYLRG